MAISERISWHSRYLMRLTGRRKISDTKDLLYWLKCVLKRNRISQHCVLARSELIGFAIVVNKTNHTVVVSFTLVYYLLTIIPIFHFMDSLTNKIVTPTDSFFPFLGYGYQFPQSITKKYFYEIIQSTLWFKSMTQGDAKCNYVRDYSALIDFRLTFCDKWQMIEQ